MPEQKYVSIKEAAQKTGYHPEYIRQLLRDGKVQGGKPWGRDWGVDLQDLLRHLQSARVQTS